MEWGNAFNGFMYMTKETVKDILQVLLGSVLFAISLNIFLIPVQVYSAGFMGIAPVSYTHLTLPTIA